MRGGSDERWARCAVVAPLLAVLARLHGHYHVVHRDIKLENIFLTGDGALRLGDFGLSLVLGEDLPFARAGTLDYMVRSMQAGPWWLEEGLGRRRARAAHHLSC